MRSTNEDEITPRKKYYPKNEKNIIKLKISRWIYVLQYQVGPYNLFAFLGDKTDHLKINDAA